MSLDIGINPKVEVYVPCSAELLSVIELGLVDFSEVRYCSLEIDVAMLAELEGLAKRGDEGAIALLAADDVGLSYGEPEKVLEIILG